MKHQRTISRRDLLRGSAAGLGLMAGCASLPEGDASRAQGPLNVLYINTDQQRWDAMSCAGNPYVRTPHLDRLAREGVRFTNAITPQPMCTAARTAIMTGLSIHTTNCVSATTDPDMHFPTGTFDQVLAGRGYTCEHHGRYHVPEVLADCYANTVNLDYRGPYKQRLLELYGPPPAPVEGQYVNYLSDWPYQPDPMDFHARAALGRPPRHNVDGVNYGIDTTPEEYSYSAFVADETIDALKRNQDRPFCITAAFLHPHHPQYVPESWAARISAKDIPPPATLHDRRLNTPWADWAWQVDDIDIANMGLIQARYYQLVEETDHHIGRVLDALDALGLRERTLLVFLSDHGEFLGRHGLAQKFLPYQDAVRVPYLMRLPGVIPEGAAVEEIVNTMDTFATIFDYLEAAPPPQEGHSLRPAIAGERGSLPEHTFSEFGWESGYTMFMSRSWKYVWSGHPQQMDVLFDLESDPLEETNLLGNHPAREKYVPEARKVREAMLAWMDSIGHPYLDRAAADEIG